MNIYKLARQSVRWLILGLAALAIVFGAAVSCMAFFSARNVEACRQIYGDMNSDYLSYLGADAIVTLSEKGYRLSGCGMATSLYQSYPLHTEACTIDYDPKNQELTLVETDKGEVSNGSRVTYKLGGDHPSYVPSLEDLRLQPGFAHC